jgi:enoyl-CoA hydratase/carnithine racemase
MTTTTTNASPPPTDKLLVERRDLPETGAQAMLLTLNRPEALNPVDEDVIAALNGALREADADPDVRAILFTGTGRAFTAGGDLKHYGELRLDRVAYEEYLRATHETFIRIRQIGTPFISLVNGICAAAGLELILFSDWAYAADTARIGDMHLNYAVLGGAGNLSLLSRSIHPARARELVLSGRLLSAQEAFEWGLVNRVVPADELLDAGLEAAAYLARKSSLVVRHAKEAINGIGDMSLEAAMRHELTLTVSYTTTSEDIGEGIDAFTEKRAPKFAGR